MACCVFTAYFMSRIIKACELLDIRLLEIKYNDSDPDSYSTPGLHPYIGPGTKVREPAANIDNTVNRRNASQSEPLSTVRILITGMTCAACVSTLTHALTSVPSVVRTNVSLPLSRATVIYNATHTSTEDVISAIEDVGYGAEVVGQGNRRSAAQNLQLIQREEELQALKKAFNGAAKWATTITVIEWVRRTSTTQPGNILDSILSLMSLVIGCYVQVSYAKWVHHNAWASCFSRKLMQFPSLSMDTLLSLSLLLSMFLSFFNIALHGLSDLRTRTYFSSASFLTVVISGGRYLDVTLRSQGATGLARLFRLQHEMELETVMVEGRLQKQETGSDEGDEAVLTAVPTTLLAPLDKFHISPQSLIPCDSYVVRGTSLVDESNMTGESIPSRKTVGDFLMSGTRNLSAGLVAIVLQEQNESSLEKLVESVETATEFKYDPIQTGASSDDKPRRAIEDIITKYFVSTILVLTLFRFIFTFVLSADSSPMPDRLNAASERAMAILAAACPCAIGLATPSAVMAGIDAAYASGILLPGGADAFKKLSRLTHMVLDKTGTLTEGKLQISDAFFVEPFRSDERKRELCYSLLSAAERDASQTHPVARAVFQWCVRQLQATSQPRESRGVMTEPGAALVRNISSVTGKGVCAEVQGPGKIWYTAHIGSDRFLSDHDISLTPAAIVELGTVRGTTAVHFALDGKYAGTFMLQDTIRSNAPGVIDSLKSLGLRLTMLTGDSEAEAHRVSSQLQIPVLAAKSLPHEKRDLVVSLQSQHLSPSGSHGKTAQLMSDMRQGFGILEVLSSIPRRLFSGNKGDRNIVAMLGDGLNDAPAQAAADVGILFSLSPLSACHSASTSSLALGICAAEVIVTTPDLAALPKLITIATKTMAQARWNMHWAVLYNAFAIALAMGAGELMGFKSVDASTAGTMMAFSSITVLGTSLHLRRRFQ
ncbi:uncharacterized protein Z519_02742 [Cladophialophora bantiana CBS 173.52]|uniref:HMA domain-containing protein n=1 Tax=Cladophialophora bantiana (strain ATCC 10958 / CBS 173.52 / CDC B-1940 / NIH 8579) TaxID=1442370 RepID=A0A0D2I2B1_CLAB1|nr:uncharacterized protein Z519_02742 [Cladophialophora bantiana CBS 173.52]KIW97350.1 hypothetical protein Z519_02742 [Cladophialophora bantiana CBS 173.52]